MDSLVSNDLPGFENSRLMTLGSMVRPEDTVGLIIETGVSHLMLRRNFPDGAALE